VLRPEKRRLLAEALARSKANQRRCGNCTALPEIPLEHPANTVRRNSNFSFALASIVGTPEVRVHIRDVHKIVARQTTRSSCISRASASSTARLSSVDASSSTITSKIGHVCALMLVSLCRRYLAARHAVGATIGSRPESDVVVVNELKNVTLTKFLATVGSCQQSHLPPRSKLDRPLLLPLHEPIA